MIGEGEWGRYGVYLTTVQFVPQTKKPGPDVLLKGAERLDLGKQNDGRPRLEYPKWRFKMQFTHTYGRPDQVVQLVRW